MNRPEPLNIILGIKSANYPGCGMHMKKPMKKKTMKKIKASSAQTAECVKSALANRLKKK